MHFVWNDSQRHRDCQGLSGKFLSSLRSDCGVRCRPLWPPPHLSLSCISHRTRWRPWRCIIFEPTTYKAISPHMLIYFLHAFGNFWRLSFSNSKLYWIALSRRLMRFCSWPRSIFPDSLKLLMSWLQALRRNSNIVYRQPLVICFPKRWWRMHRKKAMMEGYVERISSKTSKVSSMTLDPSWSSYKIRRIMNRYEKTDNRYF